MLGAIGARWGGAGCRFGAMAVVAGLLVGLVPAGAALAQRGPQVATLSNGARLIVEERPSSPTLAVVAALRYGARDEPAAEQGISDLLRAVHVAGSVQHPSPEALELPVTSVGGSFDSSVDADLTVFQALVPARFGDRAFAALGETLGSPAFTDAIVEQERRLMLDDLTERQGDADSVSQETILATTLPGHPGVVTSRGAIATLPKQNRQTLLDRRARYYAGANLTVSVVGNLSLAQATAQSEAAFGALPRGSANPVTPVKVPPLDGVKRVDLQVGEAQAVVSFGFQSAGHSSPDRPTQMVLDNLMGIFSGRINTAIRGERGLAYGAYAYTYRMADTGAWLVSVDTAPKDVDEVIGLVVAEIQRVRDEPITEAELAQAKGASVYDLVMRPEGARPRAMQLARRTALNVDITDEALARGIDAVTVADVQRVARHYLTLDHYALVVTVPADE